MPTPPLDHFRCHARHASSLPVRVGTARAPEPYGARLLDLGLGGACLEIAERYEPGERLTLHLELPQLWDPLVVAAEVAWCEARAEGATRAGVRFTTPSGRNLRLIAEALASG